RVREGGTPPRTAFGSPTLPLQGRVVARDGRRLSSAWPRGLAVAPLRGPAVADLLESQLAVEAFANEIVPAIGLRPDLAMTPAHDQTLGRAGHRHVQQPAILVLVFVERRLARRSDRAHIEIAASGPDDACRRAGLPFPILP